MNKKWILANNKELPLIGLGTCKHSYAEPIDSIVKDAIECGYRYFDTASFYCTERDLGRALNASGLKRNEYILASKCWYEELGYENVKKACHKSLERLNHDYLDLYLIHWPKSAMDDPNWKEKIIDTWKGLIELKQEGYVKDIGVSNFLPHHLDVILENFEEIPVVDQLELHLGYFQEYAINYLEKHHIQAQAWSPLARGIKNENVTRILSSIADKYHVSISQLSIRFLLQRNVMPLIWSTSKKHMQENLDVFDFEISKEDMSLLSCMPQLNWLGEHPDFFLPLNKHLNENQ